MLKLTYHYQAGTAPHRYKIKPVYSRHIDGSMYWFGVVIRFKDKYLSFGIKNDRTRKEEAR